MKTNTTTVVNSSTNTSIEITQQTYEPLKPLEYNEKISQNNKSGMFIISAFSMIILHLLVWIITLIIKFLSRKKPIGSLI